MNRRELFSSFGASLKGEAQKGNTTFLRPPYFKNVALFHKECSICENKCDTICEEEVIKIADDGTPYLVFNSGGCTYCDDCAVFCEHDVLNVENKQTIKANITIDKNKCMSWEGVMCFSCIDPCLDNAIDFKAMFMPEINNKCTACGFCISRCPSYAINVEVINEKIDTDSPTN